MVGGRSNGGIIEVDGERSNNGTSEVVGGGGLNVLWMLVNICG